MTQHSRLSSSRFSEAISPTSWPLLLAAGAFGGFVLLRRTKTSAALAGAGLWAVRRAACHTSPRSYTAQSSFAANCTAERAYNLWRRLDEVPRYLRHVHSVRVLDEKRSEWTVLGPFDQKFRWIAEIVEDRPGERIVWQSVAGSIVETHGTIEFRPRTAGRGVDIIASISWTLPAGSTAQGLLTILGRHPQFTLREDLRRFKSLLEAGEVPTIVGQTHGPRGLRGQLYREILRERQNSATPQAAFPEPRIA